MHEEICIEKVNIALVPFPRGVTLSLLIVYASFPLLSSRGAEKYEFLQIGESI